MQDHVECSGCLINVVNYFCTWQTFDAYLRITSLQVNSSELVISTQLVFMIMAGYLLWSDQSGSFGFRF